MQVSIPQINTVSKTTFLNQINRFQTESIIKLIKIKTDQASKTANDAIITMNPSRLSIQIHEHFNITF